MPTRTEYETFGSSKGYIINLVRCSSGNGGRFKFYEKFQDSLDSRFDAYFSLGASMNHNSANNNVINSWPWTGFSKQARRIETMYLLKAFVALDEASSENSAYTQVKIAVMSGDMGKNRMPELEVDGVFAFGWTRNFYAAVNVADQNKLEVWNGAALADMNDYQYGAVHNRTVESMIQSPLSYDYGDMPISCQTPITFYHWVNGNVSLHAQWTSVKLFFGVRFFRRKKWWHL